MPNPNQPHNQQQRPQQPQQSNPPAQSNVPTQASTEQTQEPIATAAPSTVPEKVEGLKMSTIVESPQDKFYSQVHELFNKVASKQISTRDAIHQLHAYWDAQPLEEQAELSQGSFNAIDTAGKLKAIIEALHAEIPVLQSKYFNRQQ